MYPHLWSLVSPQCSLRQLTAFPNANPDSHLQFCFIFSPLTSNPGADASSNYSLIQHESVQCPQVTRSTETLGSTVGCDRQDTLVPHQELNE